MTQLDRHLERADQYLKDIAEREQMLGLEDEYCPCGGDLVYIAFFEGIPTDIPGGRCVDCGVSG